MKANRKRILVLAAAAAAVAAVGVTMAFMFRKADAENRFEPATVTCTVHEQLNDDTFTAGTHTGDVKSISGWRTPVPIPPMCGCGWWAGG